MPHSSGGGSSSGGSHSGSRRDRYIRRKYYKGSDRYVRYKKNGEIEYAYSHRNISFLPKGISYIGLAIAAFLITMSISFTVSEFKYPDKLDTSSYQSEIFISDARHDLKNVKKLGARLDEFQDLTGISVCVKTLEYKEWSNDYSKLEDYAYDDYVRTFEDESHWLLVYSEGDPKGNNKWYWEGMQGNDTDYILTTHFADKFTKTVQKRLEKGDSFDEAVITGLDEISPKIMTSYDYSFIFGSILLIGVIGYLAYIFCIEDRTGNRSRYIKIEDGVKKPKMTRCYTCGKSYVTGSVPVCPFCYNVDRYKFDPFYRSKVKKENLNNM